MFWPWTVTMFRTHIETLVIYKLGLSQNDYTFALKVLKKIVLHSTFLRNEFLIDECLKSHSEGASETGVGHSEPLRGPGRELRQCHGTTRACHNVI